MSKESQDFIQEDEINLVEYWLLIKHNYQAILKLGGAIMLLTALVVFQMTPIYRGTALVLIDSPTSRVMTVNDMYEDQRASIESFNAQIQVIKSRPVAERVIRDLKLYDNPDLDPRKKTSLFSSKEYKGTPEEIQNQLVQELLPGVQASLEVSSQRLSQIVEVNYDSPDPKLAAKIANAYVDAYIDNDLESRAQMTQRANLWFTKRMQDLRQKLETAEKALQEYRERENIVDNKSGIVLSGAGKQLEAVSGSLIDARVRLAEAQSAYDQIKNRKNLPLEEQASVPAVSKDPTVQQTKEAESAAMRKLTEYKGRYAAAHPKMIAAETEYKAARTALQRAVDAAVMSITREYEAARMTAGAIYGAQSQTKAEIQSLNRKEFQLSVLQREVDSNKQLYDTFMNRAKESEAAANLQSVPGRLIDPAVEPTGPIKPKKLLSILLAGLLGVFAGVALVFLRHHLDNTLHSVPDAERKLGVDVLGAVQRLEAAPGHEFSPARQLLADPNSTFAESIRTLRTSILLSAVDDPHRVVVMTSTVPGEGKTTLSINLAYALGQMKRVLLVEADIRKPAIGKNLGEKFKSGPGLVEYLAGEAELEKCIHPTESPNVFILPAGKRVKSPLELISTKHFGDTVEKLKGLYEVVIIDCPPLKPVSDALVISKYANAVIYVVKADSTPYQLALESIRRMQEVDAPVLGVVLNQIDFSKGTEGRYSYYSYRYQYQYGYGHEESQPQSQGKRKTFLGIRI